MYMKPPPNPNAKAKRGEVLACQLRVLKQLDPGHEAAHYTILKGFNSLIQQRKFVREMLVQAIFSRSANSMSARRAGIALRAIELGGDLPSERLTTRE
jgi:hypothetical protein